MRDIPVGNGRLLVNFDDKYQIRDIYFPRVGQENHTEGFPFRFGIWVDDEMSWASSDDWLRELRYLRNSLITDVVLVNETLGVRLECNDTVDNAEDIYFRRIKVMDLSGRDRNIRVFLHHDFRIYENKIGDTAFYDPESGSLIHYKKHRYFLINTDPHFDEFATGRKAFRHSEGTWRDAEDGSLEGGAITEGSVDSTIAVHLEVPSRGEAGFSYWIAAGTTYSEVADANRRVLERDGDFTLKERQTSDQAWLARKRKISNDLPPKVTEFYDRSLLIARTQIDSGGAIIAATDHDVTERATDHYSYIWPRDAAFVANAFDTAGYPEISEKLFSLCAEIVDERGYFLQKYNPDGSVGSGWHPYWNSHTKTPTLPIQEDETALILWAVGERFRLFPDIEYFSDIYDRLVIRCADFLVSYRDYKTLLPLPSWNLWEDRRGVHAFTCSTVVAGLRAASRIAEDVDDFERASIYSTAADETVAAINTHLWSHEHDRFLRSLIVTADNSLVPDSTVDASLFGLFYFGCFAPDDPLVVSTMSAVRKELGSGSDSEVGGIARFENDGYMAGHEEAGPNPWIITTLWYAEFLIASAEKTEDLAPALNILNWAIDHALPSGVLAEQFDRATGRPCSVSPLTWSHSTFIAVVNSYLAKQQELDPAVHSISIRQ